VKDITALTARALVRTLTRGTALAEGARYIHVGHDRWLSAQMELLGEIAEDGHAETKFVRGAYGAGKSHFLSVVQDLARDAGWVTSHIECKVDGVQIDRFETLFPRIAARMLLPGGLSECGDPIQELVNRWLRNELRKAGVRQTALTRPFDIEERLIGQLRRSLLVAGLLPDFARALAVFARASVSNDLETTMLVCEWLRGAESKIDIPAHYLSNNRSASRKADYLQLRPITRGTAHEFMKGLLWLVRGACAKGLVLCIDEVEELAKLPSRKRQDQALQALREYVDHAGGEGGYKHVCIYLAATPEMFEGEDYFPRYDALATRIQPLTAEINWRAPVIDLDKTPLHSGEMRLVAAKIADVHRIAYGAPQNGGLNGEFIDQLIDSTVRARFRIAKPRLLARTLVDELERARQNGNLYEQSQNTAALVAAAYERLTKESAE
jgi:hypothetical protein